jgi:anti-sigma regulatory factor (Ser/Thr protein kinase)
MKDLSMHIMDIAQNSISAMSSELYIEINENMDDDAYTITIADNGIGMTRDYLSTISDPYVTSRSTRKVGLGIPLLKQNAERTGGSIEISSEPGQGTTVKAIFIFTHPDRPPIGDIAGTIVLLCVANPELDLTYHHITNTGEYNYNTMEIRETLDGVPINEASVARFLKEMIIENLDQIGISK